MEWRMAMRGRRGALVAALLLAVRVAEVGLGANGRPGMDETIFDPVVEQPKPV